MEITSRTAENHQFTETIDRAGKSAANDGSDRFQQLIKTFKETAAQLGAENDDGANISPYSAINSHSPMNSSINEALVGLQMASEGAAEPGVKKALETTHTPLQTNKGVAGLDLDVYYADEPLNDDSKMSRKLSDVPLLFPSAQTIDALKEHASSRLQQLLSEYDIAEAPDSISYNSEGRMILPADYAYAKEFRDALENHPGLERELRDLNALSSHYVEIQKRMPFVEAMQTASSQSEIDRLIAQYSHLLHDNHSYSKLELKFSADGRFDVLADGKAVKLG